MKWGGGWRIPTAAEYQELIDKCRKIYGITGITFIGPNGKSIFFPFEKSNKSAGEYWTATRSDSNSELGAYMLDLMYYDATIKTRIHEVVGIETRLLLRGVTN